MSANKPKITPMMAQYFSIKKNYTDTLLFYRMGDFYELFFEDAIKASEALNIILTSRGKHLEQKIPMCGVPVHSANNYLLSLIKKGFKVAVCEQLEDPLEAKKRGYKAIVKRDVVRVITPGTLTEDSLLEAHENNFLGSLSEIRGSLALAWVDISTGDFIVTSCNKQNLKTLILRLNLKELLVSDNLKGEFSDEFNDFNISLTPISNAIFESTGAKKQICGFYGVKTLEGFGAFSRTELSAINSIISYLELTQKSTLPILKRPLKEVSTNALQIDSFTRKNLEIIRSLSGEKDGSLLDTIDKTITACGARLLTSRLNNPSSNKTIIIDRLNDLEFFYKKNKDRINLQSELKNILDIERALTRISLNRSNPRDIKAVGNSLQNCDKVYYYLNSIKPPHTLSFDIKPLAGHKVLIKTIEDALREDLSNNFKDGGFVKTGYNDELDKQRNLRDKGAKLLGSMQQELITLSEVSSLKIKHNNVLGYFIEIPTRHSQKLLSPPLSDVFIHRQTTANSIRFTTTELGKAESNILNATSAALNIELDILNKIQTKILKNSLKILDTARIIAIIDVNCALSQTAQENDWCKPTIDDSRDFEIINGRHPVVEKAIQKTSESSFIPNCCNLSCEKNNSNIWLITGPNMAGKSTFLRQNALLVILAQMGSYVPAKSAKIGIVDQLFSRIGASDDIAKGHSTFMMEMVETAVILNQATMRSLVILDEIGRGTSTFDGLSIAWATLEYLHEKNLSRGLFATHYHELTVLSKNLEGLTNATVKVKEHNDEIIFLYEVGLGIADKSYGVQVAKLAGMPPEVLERAKSVLVELSSDEHSNLGNKDSLLNNLPLFDIGLKNQTVYSSKELQLKQKIDELKPDELTPREALEAIYDLKKYILN